MKERYDKVVLFREREHREYGILQELPKPPFEQIHSQAVSFLEPLENGLVLQTNKLLQTTYKTLHSFAFELLFKPDLGEMVSQLPEEVFRGDVDKVYISVDLDWPNFADVETENGTKTYHRGKTTVWRKP
jgi:hypothetical protein